MNKIFYGLWQLESVNFLNPSLIKTIEKDVFGYRHFVLMDNNKISKLDLENWSKYHDFLAIILMGNTLDRPYNDLGIFFGMMDNAVYGGAYDLLHSLPLTKIKMVSEAYKTSFENVLKGYDTKKEKN